jgi:hypothetical protein
VRGEDTLARGRGGGGQYFVRRQQPWPPDTALYSTYIVRTRKYFVIYSISNANIISTRFMTILKQEHYEEHNHISFARIEKILPFLQCFGFLLLGIFLTLLITVICRPSDFTNAGIRHRTVASAAQSRQSTRLFLQSSEFGPPSHPLTRRRVCNPPPPFGWGGDTFACWRGRTQFGRGDMCRHSDTLGILYFGS